MDWITEFLFNPLFLLIISIPIFVFVGMLVGSWLSQPRKPRVLKISPETGRGEELEVESQDTINAYCNPIGNSPPQRFIKRHQALSIIRKGFLKLQTYALWLGRQGTAYTETIEGNPTPVKVSMRDAIYNMFGKDLYAKIPNDRDSDYLKDRIEKSSVSVTVEFSKNPLTPEGLPSISSDDVRRGAIDSFIERLVRGVDKLGSSRSATEWVKVVFIMGSGVAIGIVLSLIFGWGAPVVISGGT